MIYKDPKGQVSSFKTIKIDQALFCSKYWYENFPQQLKIYLHKCVLLTDQGEGLAN